MTELENKRRRKLVDKEIDGTITKKEARELAGLQLKMHLLKKKAAPVPIWEARTLHKKLRGMK